MLISVSECGVLKTSNVKIQSVVRVCNVQEYGANCPDPVIISLTVLSTRIAAQLLPITYWWRCMPHLTRLSVCPSH